MDAAATLKYALYPNSYADNFAMGANEVLTLYSDPSVSYSAYNSIPTSTLLAGKLSGTKVTMKNPCAFLKVTFPDSTNGKHLKKVYHQLKVEGSGVSGKFTAKFEDDSLVVLSKGNTDEIRVSPRAKDTLSYGAVYIPVVPGTYDTLKISLFYYDHRGLYTFSRTSKTAQTFKSNNVYDLHEFAGPLAESATTGLFTINGTTLTMNGSATVWKYAGVTNSNYGFKFLYREAGAADWDSVDATPSGDGQQVTFTADVTIDTTKTYEYKAQVTACATAVEGDIASTGLTFTTAIMDFTKKVATYAWAYDESSVETGYFKHVTDTGEDVFPNGSVSSAVSNHVKKWDGSKWGEKIDTTIKTSNLKKIIGGTLTMKDDLNNDCLLYFPATTSYYCVANKKLCCADYSIKVCCPTGKTIQKITLTTLSTDSDENFKWGLGSASGTTDLFAKTVGTITEQVKAIVFNVPTPAKDKDLWIVGGKRIQKITILYSE